MQRSYLFVPGDDAHRLPKALASDADAVLVDLEDAVREENKAAARETIANILGKPPGDTPQKPWILRCNGPSTPHFADDLALARSLPCDGLMLPKCESREDVLAAAAWEGRLIPLIESARGIHRLEEILCASPCVLQAAFGSVDFALDLGVAWTPGGTERQYAMGRLALVSRALGVGPPIDAVFMGLDDATAFRADVITGKQMGFSGKMVIHPKQIACVHEIYAPTPAELARAERVLKAYAAAGATGAIRLDGEFIDLPVVEAAKQLLRAAGRD